MMSGSYGPMGATTASSATATATAATTAAAAAAATGGAAPNDLSGLIQAYVYTLYRN